MQYINQTNMKYYIRNFRTHLVKHFSEDYVIGSIYSDDKNITYFPFTPKELKTQKLKIAIVFNHPQNRFEVWLAGQNRQIQKQYWEMFKGSDWNKYHIPENISEGFSIVDHILVEDPDLNDMVTLTEKLEEGIFRFIKDMIDALIEN